METRPGRVRSHPVTETIHPARGQTDFMQQAHCMFFLQWACWFLFCCKCFALKNWAIRSFFCLRPNGQICAQHAGKADDAAFLAERQGGSRSQGRGHGAENLYTDAPSASGRAEALWGYKRKKPAFLRPKRLRKRRTYFDWLTTGSL